MLQRALPVGCAVWNRTCEGSTVALHGELQRGSTANLVGAVRVRKAPLTVRPGGSAMASPSSMCRRPLA